MQSFKGKIQRMLFEYAPRWLTSQGCTNLVTRVQGLGFQVYEYEKASSGFLGQELQGEVSIANAMELIAKSN